ncbi:hypothetical protein HF086_016754 [Spodoptera exigua]|uniref:Endonuclease/exonuclease/phosphatase domain-containing protein n=1 Tax=Spodoptera exigua TaxID=7107 RepID=A0A922SM85_SPOEX|nr:hypothetical protein HF086_016754 [Spodoptera exigua]
MFPILRLTIQQTCHRVSHCPFVNLQPHGKSKNVQSISVLYQNVRGLKTKLPIWRNNLALFEHNLVAVTETFLHSSVGDSELETGDWNVLRRDRNTPCAGVLLAARIPLVLHRRMEYETDCGEDLWASFTWHRRSYLVCIVYIKPSASVLIMGDLNLKSASINVANYYCYFLSFCSLVDKNVILNHHGGMLDVVLVREGSHGVCVSSADGIVQPDAYHPPMEVEVRIESAHCSDVIEPSNINPARDWNFNKCDYEQLYLLLSKISWDRVMQTSNVSVSSIILSTIFLTAVCLKNVAQRPPVEGTLYGSHLI